MKTNRTYHELSQLNTFEERFHYLALKGVVGTNTFGFDRWLNQGFYRSREWKQARELIIIRDEGCDLGVPGFEIFTGLYVHHMNPISALDITHGNDSIVNPDQLICTSLRTHNAIHFGDERLLPLGPVVRQAGDTRLW